jgi:hypothetical protein
MALGLKLVENYGALQMTLGEAAAQSFGWEHGQVAVERPCSWVAGHEPKYNLAIGENNNCIVDRRVYQLESGIVLLRII